MRRCRRSAPTGATSASRPTKARASRRSPTGRSTNPGCAGSALGLRARHGDRRRRNRARSRSSRPKTTRRKASPTNSRAPTKKNVETDVPRYGAVAAGRSAITADGRTVAFVTTAQSDLAGPDTPRCRSPSAISTPTKHELVSVRFDPATGRPAINSETGAPEPVPEEEGRVRRGLVQRQSRHLQPPATARSEPYTSRPNCRARRSARTAAPSPGTAGRSPNRRARSAREHAGQTVRRAAVAADRERPRRTDAAGDWRLGPRKPGLPREPGGANCRPSPRPGDRLPGAVRGPAHGRRGLLERRRSQRLRPAPQRERRLRRVPRERPADQRRRSVRDRRRNSTATSIART